MYEFIELNALVVTNTEYQTEQQKQPHFKNYTAITTEMPQQGQISLQPKTHGTITNQMILLLLQLATFCMIRGRMIKSLF